MKLSATAFMMVDVSGFAGFDRRSLLQFANTFTDRNGFEKITGDPVEALDSVQANPFT